MAVTVPEDLDLIMDEDRIRSKNPDDLVKVFAGLKKQLVEMYQGLANAVNVGSRYTILRVENQPFPTEKLGNLEVNFYLNETEGKLMLQVKYADGTQKSGEVALT